jgi:hypothetical protein
MRRNMNVALVSVGLLLGTAGCNSFLTGDKLSNDPNNPTSGSIQTLLVGIQGGQFAFQEGTAAMMVCEWVQQCGATNGRFVEQAGRYVFGAGSNIGANAGDWLSIYAAGGLIDMDTIINVAGRSSDAVSQEFVGIAEVWKAFTVGSAADMWGSIPYSQIRTSATPALDSQLVVYDTVQAILDRAITTLTASGSNAIPQDLVFGGDAAKWIATAHTLKARYFLHTVEAAANGKLGARTVANVFTDAIAQATSGIADASGASDFRSFHVAGVLTQQNMWSQFQTNSAFASDLESGKALVDYMKGRNDPRLGDYFCQNAPLAALWKPTNKYKIGAKIQDPNGNRDSVSAATQDSLSGATEPIWPVTVGGTVVDNHVTWTQFGRPWKASNAYKVGANLKDPNGNAQQVTTAGTSGATEPVWSTTFLGTTTDGTVTWTSQGSLPYGGDDFNVPQPNVGDFGCEPLRFSADFRQPYVTYQENQLILAEANLALGNTAAAETNLNNAYAVAGVTSSATGVVGAALLDSIMMEKYVVMFQNIEALSDYRRTCIPNLAYVSGNVLGLTAVPGELFYPQTERNVNSQNIPTESSEVNGGVRTSSDVKPCTGAGSQAYP